MKSLVILGAGTAGTMMSARLRKLLSEREWSITVVDRDDTHIYQPGLLFIPFGMYRVPDIVRPRTQTVPTGVKLNLSGIVRVEPDNRTVYLGDQTRLHWDVLIVATGSHLRPEETPGLTGPGWHQSIFDFYSLEGATGLASRLDHWEGGRILVHINEMPIKCPVAPLEFSFLLDAWLTGKGLRSHTEIRYITPLEGAFTKPRAAAAFGNLLEKRGVGVQGDFNTAQVDGEKGTVTAFDGRVEPFDLLVTIPVHGGADVIRNSQLGDAGGWVPTHRHTLQSLSFDHIFVLGDATDLPSSKAGSVAHFQGEVLTRNILNYIENRPLVPDFDGHANCFIETGYGKAMLIDFNYTTEPLPGRFPLPGVGPFTLLEESHVNHWGKLAFKWTYWNVLLTGSDLPLDHHMSTLGKWS